MPKRVAFFNPVFAHYRRALLGVLLSDPRFDFMLFGDAIDRHGGVKVIDLTADPHFTAAACHRFLGRLVWQEHTLPTALWGRYDAFILEGDAQYLSTWMAAVAARIRGKRVLFWTHGWTRDESGPKDRLRTLFYRLADGLLLYGERARAIGLARGFPGSALYVMYNSLDHDGQVAAAAAVTEERRQAIYAAGGLDPRHPTVIASARLTPRKRFDLLLEAMGDLARAGHPLNLILLGDGPARESLRQTVDRLHLRALCPGAIYEEADLAAYFACATVCVSPGEIGLTAMHSLSYGVPVITHDDINRQGPEFEALIDGVTGTTFRRDDAADLAARLRQWTTAAAVPDGVRQACIERVRSKYHARAQAETITRALQGLPAA